MTHEIKITLKLKPHEYQKIIRAYKIQRNFIRWGLKKRKKSEALTFDEWVADRLYKLDCGEARRRKAIEMVIDETVRLKVLHEKVYDMDDPNVGIRAEEESILEQAAIVLKKRRGLKAIKEGYFPVDRGNLADALVERLQYTPFLELDETLHDVVRNWQKRNKKIPPWLPAAQ